MSRNFLFPTEITSRPFSVFLVLYWIAVFLIAVIPSPLQDHLLLWILLFPVFGAVLGMLMQHFFNPGYWDAGTFGKNYWKRTVTDNKRFRLFWLFIRKDGFISMHSDPEPGVKLNGFVLFVWAPERGGLFLRWRDGKDVDLISRFSTYRADQETHAFSVVQEGDALVLGFHWKSRVKEQS